MYRVGHLCDNFRNVELKTTFLLILDTITLEIPSEIKWKIMYLVPLPKQAGNCTPSVANVRLYYIEI